jgi:hypothetical protein
METEFTIDADIRVAKTLPARVYADPTLFHSQRDQVFARTWHYAASDDVVKVAGQVHPFTLLQGTLDELRQIERGLSASVYSVLDAGALVIEDQQLRSAVRTDDARVARDDVAVR